LSGEKTNISVAGKATNLISSSVHNKH